MIPSAQLYPWYALRVRSKCEFLTEAALRGKGFETFVPSYRSRRIWSDRVKELTLPLYPGYVFSRFEFEKRLPVLQSIGVVDVINDGRRGITVPEDEIDAVRRIVESNVSARPWPFIKVGQRVEVRKGPLQGLEGILLVQKKNYRLVVSIPLLQRSVKVEIEADWVRPVSSPVSGLAS